jgi:hypothetical protein
MLSQVEDSSDENANRAEVSPSTARLANHFAANTVLLVFKLERRTCGRVERGLGSTPNVKPPLANKELHIAEAKRRRFGGRIISIFSWAQKEEEC